MFAIYIQDKEILLTDGCWTNKNNLKKPWFVNANEKPFYQKPRLFCTRGGAKNYLHKHTNTALKSRYKIKKFTEV